MTEVKEKRWSVSLPLASKDDAAKLAKFYGKDLPVALGNAVAKAVRDTVKAMEVSDGK
jgi:hypothetical protein